MPLSKQRNRDRMRLNRLHNSEVLDPVQPIITGKGRIIGGSERPGLIIESNTPIQGRIRLHNQPVHQAVQPKHKRRDEMTAEETGITGHDADGYPIYEED